MYLIECSFIEDNHVAPWKIIVSGGPMHASVVESYRCADKEEVINLISKLREKFGEKTIAAEHVYWGSPRLDLIHE